MKLSHIKNVVAAALLLFPTLCIAQNYGKFRLVEVANSTTKDHTPIIGSVKSGEIFNINGKEIIFNKDERNASSLFKVKINGNEVKVYKTGSFGTDVKLSPGENIVKVELYSVDGALLASGERTISRIEPAKREADEINTYDSKTYTRKLDSVINGTEFTLPGQEKQKEPEGPKDILPEEEEIISL